MNDNILYEILIQINDWKKLTNVISSPILLRSIQTNLLNKTIERRFGSFENYDYWKLALNNNISIEHINKYNYEILFSIFLGACRGDHQHLVEKCVPLFRNVKKYNHIVIKYLCSYNYAELALTCISNTSTRLKKVAFHFALMGACVGGNFDLFKVISEQYGIERICWIHFLDITLENYTDKKNDTKNRVKLINYIRNYYRNFLPTNILENVCNGKNSRLAIYLINHYLSKNVKIIKYEYLFRCAAKGGSLHLITKLQEVLKHRYEQNKTSLYEQYGYKTTVTHAIYNACVNGHILAVETILDLIPFELLDSNIWNDCVRQIKCCCYNPSQEIFIYLYAKGATNAI